MKPLLDAPLAIVDVETTGAHPAWDRVTEIAVVELHTGYPRAHVTRYTALYTSLSTTYDLEFGSLTAVAAPMS